MSVTPSIGHSRLLPNGGNWAAAKAAFLPPSLCDRRRLIIADCNFPPSLSVSFFFGALLPLEFSSGSGVSRGLNGVSVSPRGCTPHFKGLPWGIYRINSHPKRWGGKWVIHQCCSPCKWFGVIRANSTQFTMRQQGRQIDVARRSNSAVIASSSSLSPTSPSFFSPHPSWMQVTFAQQRRRASDDL